MKTSPITHPPNERPPRPLNVWRGSSPNTYVALAFLAVAVFGLFGFAARAHATLTSAEIDTIAKQTGETQDDIQTKLQGNSAYWESYYKSYLPPTQAEVQQADDRAAAERAANERAAAEREEQATKRQAAQPATKTLCNGDVGGVVGTVKAAFRGDFFACAGAWIASWMLAIAGRVLWIAGILLDLTLKTTLDFNSLLNGINGHGGFALVSIGWQALRDIANIVFIFIALWSGISIILGIKAEKAWGLLAQMVLVALFINFSLLITQAVVDASNIAALHFYNRIVDPEHKNDIDGGLSYAFMRGLNLQTLYFPKAVQEQGGNDTSSKYLDTVRGGTSISFTNIMLIGIFGSVFMLVAAFVFFAAAILFIVRTVTLMMLMILSPLAFVGLLLPGAQGLAREWWHKLWSQSFFAPFYLALAYVVVRSINDPSFQAFLTHSGGVGANPSFTAVITGFNSSSVGIVFAFILLIGLLIGCLIVAQSLGAYGSKTVMAMGQKLRGVGTGLVGRVPRKILGTGVHVREDSLAGRAFQRIPVLRRMVGKEFSVRKLDEKWEKAGGPFGGQTTFGKFLRQQTTGRAAAAKFGTGKSAQEVYKAQETMASRRRDIEHGANVREGAGTAERARRELRAAETTALATKAIAASGGVAEFIRHYEAARTGPAARPPTKEEERRYTLAKAYAGAPEKFNNALTKAERAVSGWTQTLNEAKRQISTSLARMTTEGFLEQQKSFFKNPEVMDFEVLGADKYNALVASKDFTNEEKEEATKARTKRLHEEQAPFEQAHEQWLNDYEEWSKRAAEFEQYQKEKEEHPKKKKEHDDYQALYAEAQNAGTLFEFQQQWQATRGEAPKDPGSPPEPPAWYKEQKAGFDEYERRKAALPAGADVSILGPAPANPDEPPPEPPPPTWSDDSVRKSLRNISDTRELVNYYRYDRDLFKFDHFIASVKQGVWNRMRESPDVDAATKEHNRVAKRYYIKEALTLGGGVSAADFNKLERENEEEAHALLNWMKAEMTKHGLEGYMEKYLQTGALNDELKKRGLEKLGGDNATLVNRYRAGRRMYPEVATNLANEEFEMMPGMLREHPMTLDYIGQAQAPTFHRRDIENTLPMLEFWLSQFKRSMLDTGEISDGNLQILKWIVNENAGQQFTATDRIRDDLKPILEFVKGLAAVQGRASFSKTYLTKQQLIAAFEDYQRRNKARKVGFKNLFQARIGTTSQLMK